MRVVCEHTPGPGPSPSPSPNQFPLTAAVSKAITGGESRTLDAAEQVGAGFVGGALSGVICAPMELVMIQQQLSGGSLFGTAGRVLRDHGVGTLFRGAAPRSEPSKAVAPCTVACSPMC
jgi:hypothetical protein